MRKNSEVFLSKMSNKLEISESHLDSFSIKDNLLVAYPNKLLTSILLYILKKTIILKFDCVTWKSFIWS